MAKVNYNDEITASLEAKLKLLLKKLPKFCSDYFRSISNTKSIKTRMAYAYDIKVFFEWSVSHIPVFQKYKENLYELPVHLLNEIQLLDLEQYQDYLKYYENPDGTVRVNKEKGIAQKSSALKNLFHYYQKHDVILKNPSALLDNPKIHEKVITKLDSDEVTKLIDFMKKYGEKLSGQKKHYYEKTIQRDLTIVILMLNTGIRVSECVGLNILDVNLQNRFIKILRKGGNEMIIYFNEDTCSYLKEYLQNYRLKLEADSPALFLSIRKTRISVDAIETMVKKYTSEIIPDKTITPHKLRSTYGTELYNNTGDIYLVADVLGHKDVNTTKKHYASIDENRRRMATTNINWKM